MTHPTWIGQPVDAVKVTHALGLIWTSLPLLFFFFFGIVSPFYVPSFTTHI